LWLNASALARSLTPYVTPVKWKTPDRTIIAWDVSHLETNTKMKQPLRVLHTREILDRPKRRSAKQEADDDESDWWWGTTIPESLLSTMQLSQVGHRRWDIENNVFNVLVNYWAMNHCFKHDPVAIVNFILTLFIAFILVQAFYKRNLKAQVRAIFTTLISIGDALHASLICGPPPRPWPDGPATAPP